MHLHCSLYLHGTVFHLLLLTIKAPQARRQISFIRGSVPTYPLGKHCYLSRYDGCPVRYRKPA